MSSSARLASASGTPLLEPLREEAHRLDPNVRSQFERGLGAPFGDVVVHSGPASTRAADRVNAVAFTVGRHIVFGNGAFQPNTVEGRQVLSHELMHVLQQRRGGGDLDLGERVPDLPDASRAAEESAEHASARSAWSGSGGETGSDGEPGSAEVSASPVAVAREPKGQTPPAPTIPMFQYVDEAGTTRQVTLEEAAKLQARAKRRLTSAIERVRGLADVYRQSHKQHLDMGHAESWGDLWDKPSRIWGIAANIRAGVTPPYIGMWNSATSLADQADKSVASGDLAAGARLLKRANDSLQSSMAEWNSFMTATIGGGEKLAGELEVVRDSSFAIAIAAGAIVAAPVVAGGVAAAGVTGTGATVLTALGTGAVTTAAGATLRGSADVAGQAASNGKVDWTKTGKHVRAHLKEDAITGMTAGLAPGAGKAAGLTQEGLTVGKTIVRQTAVQSGVAASTGTVGTLADTSVALAEGKSWEEARDENLLPGLKETGISTVAAGLSGPAGTLGQNLAKTGRPLLGKVVERGGEAIVAGGSTLAMGGSWRDAAKNALTTTVTSSLMAKGQRGTDAAKKGRLVSEPKEATPASAVEEPAATTAAQPKLDSTASPAAPQPQDTPGTGTPPEPHAETSLKGPSSRPQHTEARPDGNLGGATPKARPATPSDGPGATSASPHLVDGPTAGASKSPGPTADAPAGAKAAKPTSHEGTQTVSKTRKAAEAADRMAQGAADAKAEARRNVGKARAVLAEAKARQASLPPVSEPVPSAASKQKLPQAELDLRAGKRAVERAERRLTAAEAVAEAAETNHQNAQKEVDSRRKALQEAEEHAARKALERPTEVTADKPRWTPDSGEYSPRDHRRPDLRDMKEPPSAIDRHSGLRTNPDARVSIYSEPLPKRVAAPKGGTPQEVGHDLERALQEDLLGGSKYRETHTAGDKTRHGDIGSYEAKAKTELSSADLDQIWRDLNNPSRGHSAHITMPSIGSESAEALARMAASFEKLRGIRPTIVVREYAAASSGGTP